MANKSIQNRRSQEEQQEKFKQSFKHMRNLDIAAICAAGIAVLCFFFDFAQVYNSNSGVEVNVSGFSFLIAALTGNFESASTIYGDIAVPFYYYAEDLSLILGAFSLMAMIVALALIALQIWAIVKPHKRLNILSIIVSIALVILLFACFAVGIAMNESKIISVYCSGNTACSIRSYAVIAAVVAVIIVVAEIYNAVRYSDVKDMHR